MQPKPGYKTTEAAAMLLFAIGALASSLADKLSPKWAALATAIAVAAYAVSRGLAKLQVNVTQQAPPPPPPQP
jgi:Na+/proline symporter